jgi:hypothetical protein
VSGESLAWDGGCSETATHSPNQRRVISARFVEQGSSDEPKCAHPMHDRAGKAGTLCDRGVRVQGISVAIEAIEQRLVRPGSLLNLRVWWPIVRNLGRPWGPTVASPTAFTAHKNAVSDLE